MWYVCVCCCCYCCVRVCVCACVSNNIAVLLKLGSHYSHEMLSLEIILKVMKITFVG